MRRAPVPLALAGAALAAASALGAAPAGAADADNGRVLARACSACHGKLGLASDPEVPHLAGQSSLYVRKALEDYRSGARQDRRMTIMAEALTDEAIADLAAWYESIEVSATAPE